jgi:hypothetical protein
MLSSVHLASTFTVKRGDEGTDAGGPLHAPALSRIYIQEANAPTYYVHIKQKP